MKQPACSRLWQAEAIEDGRLGGGDLASFRRHMQSCRVCSVEVERLRELRKLAARLPALETTPLERRRQRQRLLRSANQFAVEPPPRVSRRLLAVAVALAATTAMAAGGAYVLRPSARSSSRVAPAPTAVARAVHHVRRAAARAAPSAALPSADERAVTPRAAPRAATPQEVARTDAPARPPAVASVHRAKAPRERIPPAARRETAVPRLAAASVHRAVPAREGTPPPPGRERAAGAPGAPAPDAAQRPPTAGQDFAVAMRAFNSGNFGRAEHLFAAFVQHHPGDSRAEDASFLRAVARQRRGDVEGAKALARDYLERYPGALRHEEAEAMLDR